MQILIWGLSKVIVASLMGYASGFFVYADGALWHKLLKTKDLQPELFRWYLRLKKFDFAVCDKANVHTLIDLGQA